MEWERLFDVLVRFISEVKNLRTWQHIQQNHPQSGRHDEPLTSKRQSRRRGFKFQKEVRHNDTRRSENDFHISSSAMSFFFLFSFKVLSLMALAALSFIVIYLPHKLFPCQAKKSIILFSSKISKLKVRAILAG